MPATVLTVDLGTSATKVALWRDAQLVTLTRAPIATQHPNPGWAEQDPGTWWSSVVDACTQARASDPDTYARVDVIGFAAARETFALFDGDHRPLSSGILWADQRAEEEAALLGDPNEFRRQTGVVLNGAACAAKLAWVARHSPEAFARARWILAPRDFVLARLTGVVVTDDTLASRTGLCALHGGGWLPRALDAYGERLPPIVAPTAVVGALTASAAATLGLGTGASVVAGAGDRACEVLGTGATTSAPMVSFGTTANVSVPHPGPATSSAQVAAVSRGALGGFLVEAGVSAAGAAVGWLSALTGIDHDELLRRADAVPPGARGLLALPWLHGARAPWWRADAHAAFLGVSAAHGPAELAGAVVEGVAFDVTRSVELVAPAAAELVVAGTGAGHDLWRTVLAGVSGHPVQQRHLDEAASVGARLVVAAARGDVVELDAINPVRDRIEPDPALVAAYGPVRAASDAAAAGILGLRPGLGPGASALPASGAAPGPAGGAR